MERLDLSAQTTHPDSYPALPLSPISVSPSPPPTPLPAFIINLTYSDTITEQQTTDSSKLLKHLMDHNYLKKKKKKNLLLHPLLCLSLSGDLRRSDVTN